MAREPGRIRRRDKKNITSGVAHINASFNNTMITITDAQGNAISWSSAGMMGFKGSRKSDSLTPRRLPADDAGKKAAEHGVRTLEVEVKGPGSGRESALRGLAAVGFNITSIRDVTPRSRTTGSVRPSVAASDPPGWRRQFVPSPARTGPVPHRIAEHPGPAQNLNRPTRAH